MKIFPLLILFFNFSAFAQDAVSEPVGYYSEGTIRNGVKIPDKGPGHIHLFLHRNRGWGTREMMNLIQNSAAAMNYKYPQFDRLQIGDISQEGGGAVTDLHSSHQNGLDADLTYYRKNHVEQNPLYRDGFVEKMVIKNRLSKNFDTARNWEFLKKLHENGDVQRIFMDPVIKKEICRFARLQKEQMKFEEVLRSLRPYANHHDHMHVRLRCPQEAKECRPQEDPPAGHGCAFR